MELKREDCINEKCKQIKILYGKIVNNKYFNNFQKRNKRKFNSNKRLTQEVKLELKENFLEQIKINIKNNKIIHPKNLKNWSLKKDDIKFPLLKIKLNLFSSKIEKSQLSFFFKKKVKDKFIFLWDIKIVLKQFPFLLCEDEARLLARYITEDNTNELVPYNENEKIEYKIFLSILHFLFRDFEIVEESQIKKIYQNFIWKIFDKKKTFFYNLINKLKIVKDVVSMQNLDFLFYISDIHLTDNEFFIIIFLLFSHNQSFEELPYTKIFDNTLI